MSSLPKIWTVPREWLGETCLIICGGDSVRDQERLIRKFTGRVIAIKQAVTIRPDADVMFISGKDDGKVCAPFFPLFIGKYIVARGSYKNVPERTKVLRRTLEPTKLSLDPSELAGLDAGTSSINLAILFGASRILLCGYDMKGGRWLNGRFKHHLPFPPQRDFDLHMAALPNLSKDLKFAGVEVINCSPISAVEVFEKRDLKEFM